MFDLTQCQIKLNIWIENYSDFLWPKKNILTLLPMAFYDFLSYGGGGGMGGFLSHTPENSVKII